MQAPLETTPAVLRIRPIVERPRLTRLLDRNTSRIKLLVAPAGYGKSTLAEQWMTHRPHAWYPCTAASSDVAGLAHDLAALIIEALPQLERELRMHLRVAAQSRDLANHFTEVMVEHLIQWPADRLLVVDDYQLIAASADSEALFEAIVARTTVPLLITARTRPAWASARQLLYGDIYELEQQALAITRAEAARLLDGKAPAVTRELTTISRGWPAILSLGWHADPRILPKRTGPLPETLQEYIASEIFEITSQLTQRALPIIALCHEVTTDFVSEALGVTEGNLLIENLVAHGLMASRRTTTILLHPLVTTFLTTHLTTHGLDAHLLSRFVRTCRRRSDWTTALRLSELSDDKELQDEIMAAALSTLQDEGRLETIRKWLTAVTNYRGESGVTLLARAGLAQRASDYTRCESLSLHAHRNLPADSTLVARALTSASTAAHLSHHDDRALKYLEGIDLEKLDDRDREAVAWGRLTASCALETKDSVSAFRELESIIDARSANAQLRIASARYVSGRAHHTFGEALEAAHLAFPLVEHSSDPMIVSVFLHVYAYMLAWNAQYDFALRVSNDALNHAARYRLPFVRSHVLSTQALALIGLREFGEADSILNQAVKANPNPESRAFTEMNAQIVRARAFIGTGDFESAAAATAPEGAVVTERGLFAELLAMHSIALTGMGDFDGAATSQARSETTSFGFEARATRSASRMILRSVNPKFQTAGSVEEIGKEIEFLVAGGASDLIVTSYRGFPDLVYRLAATDGGLNVLASLVARSRDHEIATAIHLPHYGRPPISPSSLLTPREREVADLLLAGMTNTGIATKLFIAESTAKVHLRSIFRKLGVTRRTEAAVKLLREGY